MSFGFGISDFLTMGQLAWSTFDGAKRACGEHDELTREMSSLVSVLDTVQSEVADPDSAINTIRGHRREELENQIEGCLRHVRNMNIILTKYNALSVDERGGSLWQKVRFGNGAVRDIAQIRLKISTYTTAIHISLTLLSFGSRGEAERQLSRQRGELRGIVESVNMLVAKLNAPSYESSIWSKYTDDDVEFWRSFRRQLVRKGYRSRVIRSHESLIQAYVRELESRGVFDAEMRNSQSSLYADSEGGDPDLVEEVASDLVELQAGTEPQGEATELGHGDLGISGLAIDQAGFSGKENNADIPKTRRQATVEDFENLSEFDRLQVEQPLQHLNNAGRVEEENWHGQEIPEPGILSSNETERAQDLEYLRNTHQEQRQETMTYGAEPMGERIRAYNDQLSLENSHHVNLTRSCHVDEPQMRVLSRSYLNAPAESEAFLQDVDPPLDKEKLAKMRDEAFNALPPEEKKVIITMQDPSGRRYSLPYFLIKTWEGMQYIIEQAFPNIEGIGSSVAKGEYDLVKSDGAVIIPHLWETFVEPDMLVELQIWPNSSQQTTPSLPPAEVLAPVDSTTAPSRPRSPPPPPLPHTPPPPRARFREVRFLEPRVNNPPKGRHRSPSQISSQKSSSHKTRRSFVEWPLLWSTRPPKAKSRKLNHIPPRPPPLSYMPYTQDYDCTCWECHYAEISSQEQPSVFDAPFKVNYSRLVSSKANIAQTGSSEVKYPRVVSNKANAAPTESSKKAGAEFVESVTEVEPIFEIGGEQIYELE